MNGILLDTHTLLWWLADDTKLPRWMRERIGDPEVQCLVSAATIWEIGIKRAIGKLDAPPGLISIIAEEGFQHLHITLNHAETAAALSLHHRDPFDRSICFSFVGGPAYARTGVTNRAPGAYPSTYATTASAMLSHESNLDAVVWLAAYLSSCFSGWSPM